ncbi:oxalocrotonate tautomerase [Penicillium macrosclerotiorum]|uniref:oxalocrotonate tautomerase n=1 Tax=Penicillium macrosclerotiorum TaxID=303699 RepID=UPI002546BC28|nr:oxalocrotonate tautomerase [Penicillium macrosclerotiorum]KAJ5690352.1 oxalocrotonate tautomerase [Penicillium macrosclerotiorum]
MPRWTFELSPDILSRAEKSALARQITETYVEIGIPAFLVNVFFHELPVGCFYSGGQASPPAIFFHIDHAASGFNSEEQRLLFIARVNNIVRPVLQPKDIKWEYNIYEHPRDNWRVNGLIPPIEHPEVWKEWVDKNEAVLYDESQEKSTDEVVKLRILSDKEV